MIRMPHLTWRQRLAAGAAILTVALVGGFTISADPASATDATVTYAKACVHAEFGTWGATATFVNNWEGDTIVTAEAVGVLGGAVSHTLHGNGDHWSPTMFVTSKDTLDLVTTSNHPEHFHGDATPHFTRPDGCSPPTTTVPPTTPPTTTCEQAIPVRADCGSATTPAPTTPTTVKLCEDGLPPRVPVEDGSLVCPEFGAPTQPPAVSLVAKTPPAPPAAALPPAQLPATGAGEILLVCVIAGALFCLIGWLARRADRDRRRQRRAH